MTEIVRVYRQKMPPLRFIGIRYGKEEACGKAGFAEKWSEWFADGRFEVLESLGCCGCYEDGDAYIGLMHGRDDDPLQYWIGMFAAAGTTVPEQFDYMDFPAGELGVVWVRGPESEIYGQEKKCAQACLDAGMRIEMDEKGAFWFFERYQCPRFTEPDDQGRVVLDICHFVQPE